MITILGQTFLSNIKNTNFKILKFLIRSTFQTPWQGSERLCKGRKLVFVLHISQLMLRNQLTPLFPYFWKKKFYNHSVFVLRRSNILSENVSKMLIFIFGFRHLFCHNGIKYWSNYKVKDIFEIYTKWAIEKCPTVPSRTLWVPRIYRSKSVNSFAGHPV